MRNLNKKQRHEIYKKMYELAKETPETRLWICNTYNYVTDGQRRAYMNEISEELDILSPENYGPYSCITSAYYNDGEILTNAEKKELRLTVLEFCIAMTK